MAGAIHRILLGNQEAAASWLPFAMGQFYACPEGAQTSFTPVPGVTILVKRVGGQDVVQITAGGSPDFVLYDNAVPTTASGPPLVFIPNNPERKTVGSTNAYAARLTNIGDGKLFGSHGVGLQNDLDPTKPYVERLTVWNYVSPWYTVIGGKDLISTPAESFFTVRPVTDVTDTRYQPTPGGPIIHRLVAIQGPDWKQTVVDNGAVIVSDDLGATWQTYPYPVAAVPGGYWASLGLFRIDADTLIYIVELGGRTDGFGPVPPSYFVRGTEGGVAWSEQTDIKAIPLSPPGIVQWGSLGGRFFPCKTAGTAVGMVAIEYIYNVGLSRGRYIRALRTVDSGATFTFVDFPALAQSEPVGIWFDQTTETYAALIADGRFLGNFYGVEFNLFIMTSQDEGVTWHQHPVYILTGDFESTWEISGQGFYNGRLYITFFEQGSGQNDFSYSTDDYGVTWVKHAHSEDAGRGLSSVVSLYPSGKAFPHRLDM